MPKHHEGTNIYVVDDQQGFGIWGGGKLGELGVFLASGDYDKLGLPKVYPALLQVSTWDSVCAHRSLLNS